MQNFEQIGIIPRSIVRTIQRFLKQIGLKTDLFAIYEFRVSRYIAIASLQCFCFLIVCPWIFQFFIRFLMIQFFPLKPAIFINFHQQEQAFEQIQTFSQQMYFEMLLKSSGDLQKIYQDYFSQCAHFYHQQSMAIITHWILDFTTILFFVFLLAVSTPQILILKTFFIESLLSLSETTKCFFLIFFLDLLVGFHSSKSWQIALHALIEHFGISLESKNFIAFFISTFPVLLDTIFKYWIFRYLNKISPSTVATYQAMIE
uniref:Envelope membrane protein n=1 Tax=Halimeda discoidea TaxID=118222 RepID=A0A1C9JB42_9CHLO|nr:envelope membrane protein [Halimeda discoidea]